MDANDRPLLTDEEFEALVLAHCLRRNPDCDEVSVSVRRDNAVVRYVLIRPGEPAEVLTSRPS